LLVSIIIPCYNVDEYITECLKSCYNQSYEHIEIICVDNNSQDNTYSILHNEESKGKIIFLEEKRQGASAARNLGLSVASGEWIQFLDADDLLCPDKILNQLELVEKYKCDLVYANFFTQKNNGLKIKSSINDKDIWFNLFEGSLGNTCSNLWKKNILYKIGLWNVSLKSSQEYDLLFKYLKYTENIYFDKNYLTVIRQREFGQISQSDLKGNWTRYLELRLSIIEYLSKKNPQYFKKNIIYYQNSLFDILRILYKFNRKLAIDTFKSYFDKDYMPKSSLVTSTNYVRFFRIFGFKLMEDFKKLYDKIKINDINNNSKLQ